jgi:hypothetical protein
LILSADAFVLSKTLQQVILSDLSCSDKVDYLLDYLGRIQSAINIKSISANRLILVLNTSKA